MSSPQQSSSCASRSEESNSTVPRASSGCSGGAGVDCGTDMNNFHAGQSDGHIPAHNPTDNDTRKREEGICALARECAQNSVAHGIPRLVNFKNYFELLFWVVAVIGGLLGFCIHAGSMLSEFLSDSQISTSVSFGTTPVPFPHVTICNRLPFLAAYHEQFFRGVWPKIPPECSPVDTSSTSGDRDASTSSSSSSSGSASLRSLLQLIIRLEQVHLETARSRRGIESTWQEQRRLESAAGNYTRVLWSAMRDTYGKRCLAKLFEVPTEQMVLDCSVGGVDCSPANLRVDTVWHPQYLSCKKFKVKESQEQVSSLQMVLFLNSFPGFEKSGEHVPKAFQTQDMFGTEGAQDEEEFAEPGAVVLLSAPNRSLGAGLGANVVASAEQEAKVRLTPGQEANVFSWARTVETINRISQPCEERPVIPVWNSLTQRLEPLHQRREDCRVAVLSKHLRHTANCAPGAYEVARSQSELNTTCMYFLEELAEMSAVVGKEFSSLRGAALVDKLEQQQTLRQMLTRATMINRKEHALLLNLRRKVGSMRPSINAAAAAERSLRAEAARRCRPPCNQLHYQHQTQVSDWPSAATLERVSNLLLRQMQPQKPQEQFRSRSLARMYNQVVEQRNLAYFKRNTAKVTVRLSRSSSLKVEEIWSRSLLGFLADVGGALGLWIGISAVCLCELIFFGIRALGMILFGKGQQKLKVN